MISKILPTKTRDWLRNKYNKRYAIATAIQKAIPCPGAGAAAKSLCAQAEDRRPSLLSKIVALYLIDFRPEDEELTLAISRQFSKNSARYCQYRVGDRMLRARLYVPATAAFLKRASDDNFEIHATFRYLDFLTQIHGFWHADVGRLSRRFQKPRFNRSFERSHKIKACIILLKLGKQAEAEKIYLRIFQPYVRSGQLPLYIQRNAFKLKWRDHELQRRGSDQYRRVLSSRTNFRNMIKANPEAFCVVGNGPSELGRGHGALIDSHAIVVRMNSYDLSNAADYGTKQTVWVRVPNAEADGDHAFRNAFVVIASNQFEYKRNDADRYMLQPYLLGSDLTTVPPAVFRELIKELKCLPSTGLAMLYWLYKISGPIPQERIFGFSHMEELADFRTHYFDDKIQRRIHVHAWEREAAIIARITK